MKHGREDYNGRIVDLAAMSQIEVIEAWRKVHESPAAKHPIVADEPVFVLRANDATAPETVIYWARQQKWAGNPANAESAMKTVEAMRVWQKEQGSKVADLP